jgi:hypothetical protein
MKVIIQCAASKRPGAGKLRTRSGEEVVFVATTPKPCDSVPSGVLCVRPDDPCGEKTVTWRDALRRYNEEGGNPCNLYRAADLYTPKEQVFRNLYRELVVAFRWENVFVLSAGWGLIRADFWTPDYNITFSTQGKKNKPWAWRNAKDRACPWPDFNHLQNARIVQDEPIHFFGGKDYLPTFYALVESVPGKKVVHHKGDVERRSCFDYEKYDGPEKNRTWYYRAAKDFAAEHSQAEKGS